MKYFVVSDVHSFLTPLKNALEKANFDINNEQHCLVVCGDLFDRGDESYELLKYIMSLPRKILVRGNHEDLLEECCNRRYALMRDKTNGTVKTILDIGGYANGNTFDTCCEVTLNKTQAYRDSLINYFETKNFIFVHGWIPCRRTSLSNGGAVFEYTPEWRSCSDSDWEASRWVNGIDRAQAGIICPEKTVVCGHWNCSLGHVYDSEGYSSEFGDNAKWDPWYHKGCIAIDRCTAYTNEVNVLVIDDDPLC